MVIASFIRPLGHPPKGPGVGQPVEGVVVAVIEVKGHDHGFKFVWLENLHVWVGIIEHVSTHIKYKVNVVSNSRNEIRAEIPARSRSTEDA